MLKLNLEKVHKLEQKYAGDVVSVNTLQTMIDIVMTPRDPMGLDNNSTYLLAINTLKDLEIIENNEDKTSGFQQLNS